MADPQATPPPTLSFPTDPSEFDSDERISFSKLDNKFIAVHDDGTEFEFDSELKRWIPAIDEELVRQQQSAYGGPLDDDDHYADDDQQQQQQQQLLQNQRINKKRKKDAANGSDQQQQRPHKKQNNGPQQPRQNTAVYVTGLPPDATAEEVHEVFSRKCGVVAEEIDSGRPRIKMYADEQGRFKGDALVVFFKPQSVEMAIMLLDDTDFRYYPTPPGAGAAAAAAASSPGRMRVQAADASYKKTNYEKSGEEGGGGSGNGEAARGAGAGAEGRGEGGNHHHSNNNNNGNEKPKDNRAREQEKQKIIKRTQKLDAKLADWDDDGGDPYGAAAQQLAASARRERLVILRHMFTLRELEEDPAALLEIKEDVREECSKLGPVTNVVLYDLEPEGVVAVKFRHPEAAEACVRLMDGRAFDGRIVRAAVAATGRERYRRSDKKQDLDDEEEEGGGNDTSD